MVAVGVELSSVEALRPLDEKPVLGGRELCAHGAEHAHDGLDAVALLGAQFGRVADDG